MTARMVECAVEGRTGEVGVGGGCGRGRKCVDMLVVKWVILWLIW